MLLLAVNANVCIMTSNMLLKVKPDGPVYEVHFTSQLITANNAVSVATTQMQPGSVSEAIGSNAYQLGTIEPPKISSRAQIYGDTESVTAHSSHMSHAISITSTSSNACQVGTSVPSRISSFAQMNGSVESLTAHNSHMPKSSTQQTLTCPLSSHGGEVISGGGLLSHSAVTNTVTSVGHAVPGSPVHTRRTLENFSTTGSSLPSDAVDNWYVAFIHDELIIT